MQRVGGGGAGTQVVHGRGRMTIEPRIPTIAGNLNFTNQADISCNKQREAP